MQSQHLSCVINTSPNAAYEFIADPANLPAWAAGLAKSEVRVDGEDLLMDSPMGPVRVKFVPYNPQLVADHEVTLPTGTVVYNPLRVLAHPEGCEVVFTIRQLNLTDEEFARDCEMVTQDLATLKEILEH
ncbi:SRPBCC family protein [Corynebacterium suicordis]|uniref:SRPBCC family protein n=1 Tax=Corynebacterium suicordis DSM 45110 TaxID=1121369 RepID=A0ABR9ZJN0_9CORY|nr:SRPBCC family protein [Corynebacterium suicordis]MBF4553208.1 SRPBCC family protein [Corynebacterium suicordis DSM 45110]MDR6277824.1 hypothetical protein [Corynebacterium suicordis]